MFNRGRAVVFKISVMVAKRNNVHESMLPLVAHIKASGMSEAEFAKTVLKVDQANLTNWKKRGVPQGRMQARIAAIIGKSTDQYLADIGRPTGAKQAQIPIEEAIAFDRLHKALPDWRNYVLGLAMVSSHEAQALLLSTMRNAVPDAHVEEFISAAPVLEERVGTGEKK